MMGGRILVITGCVILLALAGCQSAAPRSDVDKARDENLIAALLFKAETALGKKQYTTPDNDSALYYYRKALLIDPEHADARTGMEKLFDHFVDMAREARADGDYRKALGNLDQAEKILLPTRASKKLREEVIAEQQAAQKGGAVRKAKPAPAPVKAVNAEGVEYLLSIEALNMKDDRIDKRLRRIAEHTETLKGSVIIEGRTDAEARWIQQQMKDAVPKYKLQAVLRKSQYPKIIVVDPTP